MSKLDPRRGTVSLFRKPSPSRPARTNSPAPKQPNLEVDPLELAREIGKVIAQELKSIIQPIDPELLASRMNGQVKQIKGRPPISVNLDESIIDVGIVDSGELKTGSDSATLSDVEVVKDKSLQESKSKLRKLKRNK